MKGSSHRSGAAAGGRDAASGPPVLRPGRDAGLRRGAAGLLVLLLAACGGPESSATGGAEPPGPAGPVPQGPPPGGVPPGGQAPGTLVIPADDPRWAGLNGLLEHPGLYGEASWDDVRMRIVQHVATIGRDRARLRAMRGDLAGCAAAYAETARRVSSIATASGTGAPIRAALLGGLERDGALCEALSRDAAPPAPSGTIAPLRARLHALALRARTTDVSAEARALAADARRARAPDLSLDGFEDFEARHRLRVALVEAYVDAVDPMRPSEPSGYWSPDEVVRAAEELAVAAERLAAGGSSASDVPSTRAPLRFTVEGLGALPTGDSTVDVIGFPGPRAIGSLAVLSLEDPAHRAWLAALAARLESAPSAAVPALVAQTAAELERKPHGSRYYNVKQLRNEAVRVLATRGAHAEARTVLAASWPLHAQDWACPNRAGILRAIDARLAVAGGAPDADAALDAADRETDAMLAHVARVEGGRR